MRGWTTTSLSVRLSLMNWASSLNFDGSGSSRARTCPSPDAKSSCSTSSPGQGRIRRRIAAWCPRTLRCGRGGTFERGQWAGKVLAPATWPRASGPRLSSAGADRPRQPVSSARSPRFSSSSTVHPRRSAITRNASCSRCHARASSAAVGQRIRLRKGRARPRARRWRPVPPGELHRHPPGAGRRPQAVPVRPAFAGRPEPGSAMPIRPRWSWPSERARGRRPPRPRGDAG